MRIFLILLLLILVNIESFSQVNRVFNRSIFENGILLKHPDYNINWLTDLEDLKNQNFLNLKVKKIHRSAWTSIQFDSAILSNNYLITRAFLKVTNRKNDLAFRLREFIGIVDFETINKMAIFF